MVQLSTNFLPIETLRKNDQNELIFELKENSITVRSDKELQLLNRDKGRRDITNFISRTIFFALPKDGALTLDFTTEDDKKCRAFLEKHFGQKEESVIKFFEHLEGGMNFDKEKFEKCLKIIERTEIKSIPKCPIDANNINFFLVLGLFEDPFFRKPVEKIFLQTVEIFEAGEYHVSHEELSVELYHFSKFPRLNKMFERYSSKRGY